MSDVPESIPYSRFQQVNEQRQALSAELEGLRAELKAAQAAAGKADALTQALEAAKAQAEKAQADAVVYQGRLGRYQELAQLGLAQPELASAVESAWEGLQVEGDKPPLGEVVRGWMADPTQAPFLLRPHLGSLAQSAAPAPAPASQRQPVAQPPADRGALPAPTTPKTGKMTPEAWVAFKKENGLA